MKSMLIAILFLTFCSVASAENVTVTNIETKIVDMPGHDGGVWFAIKCAIRNNGDRERTISVTLQAVDVQGFELKTIYLSARVKPHSFKIVSQRNFMPEEDYRQARWQVKD